MTTHFYSVPSWGMSGFVSPLYYMPSWLAQRQLYLWFIICFSVRMTSDWTGTLYSCLYICSENKASLVPFGTVAVVITTEIFDYCTFVNNLNWAVECQVWMSRCKFSWGWSKSTDVRCHDSVFRTRLLCVRLTLVYFYNPVYFLFLWACFPDHKVRI